LNVIIAAPGQNVCDRVRRMSSRHGGTLVQIYCRFIDFDRK